MAKTSHYDTVNSRFKKDPELQIHLHKAFFSDNRFLDSYHKSFLNQTTLDLRKEKWSFLNREFTVLKECLNGLGLRSDSEFANKDTYLIKNSQNVMVGCFFRCSDLCAPLHLTLKRCVLTRFVPVISKKPFLTLNFE